MVGQGCSSIKGFGLGATRSGHPDQIWSLTASNSCLMAVGSGDDDKF